MTIMHEKIETRTKKPSGDLGKTAKVIFLIATVITLLAMFSFCLFYERNVCLTKKNYKSLKQGLSYSQVVEIFGGLDGEETVSWQDGGNTYVSYMFEEYGDSVTVIFENGIVYDFCENGVLTSFFSDLFP